MLNKKFVLLFVGVFSLIVLIISCGDDTPTESTEPTDTTDTTEQNIASDAASNVVIEDIGENGNGLDLSISFNKAADESKVSEYRVIVVKSSLASTFDLSKADLISSANYTQVTKTGGSIDLILTATTTDSDGNLLQNDVAYNVFVLSIADGTNSNINALSPGSKAVTLKFIATSIVQNILILDISNNGNGSDLRIRFDVPTDESTVKEYKVIVVAESDVSAFDLEAANALDAARVTTVAKTGSTIDIVLGENIVDSNGDSITNDKTYKSFVMTVADGISTSLNAISSSSGSILLGLVHITYIQNDGVLISNGENQIFIDAVVNPGSLGGWVEIGTAEQAKILNAQAPYDQIDLILVTHVHGDHYGISAINTHLSQNPNTKLIAPLQVLSGFATSSQIINIDVPKFSRETVIVNNITIDILSLRHFDAFGNDFSTVINYGYLIELDGFKILHLGDVDMTSENFDNFDLANEGIDLVITPTFVQSVHMTTSNRDVMLNQINPAGIVGTHLLNGSISTITNQVLAIYPNAIIFETSLETIIYQ